MAAPDFTMREVKQFVVSRYGGVLRRVLGYVECPADAGHEACISVESLGGDNEQNFKVTAFNPTTKEEAGIYLWRVAQSDATESVIEAEQSLVARLSKNWKQLPTSMPKPMPTDSGVFFCAAACASTEEKHLSRLLQVWETDAREEAPRATTQFGEDEIIAFRERHCSQALSVQFASKIVKGVGCHLIAADGTRYLDTVNNVAHVGHCCPEVVKAGVEQMKTLNTNTRFLNDNLVAYAKELLATFPTELGLDTIFFTNSGTEANDLAHRLATTHTNREHMVVVDHAYHGHSPTCINLSPHKFQDQGKMPTPDKTSIIDAPDTYRGQFQEDDMPIGECAEKYADLLDQKLGQLRKDGTEVAAFWAESIMGVGGQVFPPNGWMTKCHEHARAHGALCIVDEVQVGFGRVGTHWWAFETQGDVRPDIVTLGKPIGNGHPMAAVVCRKEIADSFSATGLDYFATFAGNPVSMAIGSAVLRTVKDQKLMPKAEATGKYFRAQLSELAKKHAVIGSVRGEGLMIGVELVMGRGTKTPWDKADLVNPLMREQGVIITVCGSLDNVLKIKPPLVFDESCVDVFCTALDVVLTQLLTDEGSRAKECLLYSSRC